MSSCQAPLSLLSCQLQERSAHMSQEVRADEAHKIPSSGEWLLTFQKVNQSRYFMECNHFPGPKCNNRTKPCQTIGRNE